MVLNFQDMILLLQQYWKEQNCAILQPYDMEMGAGTFHPATPLYCLGDQEWNVAYVQPSRRPADGRYGDNPNRLYRYNQFQVILKPAPDKVQDLYLKSLEILGVDLYKNDIRFVEDDWESPTLGAWGLGWEVWLNGMEATQFTYMQQIGGIECSRIACEITYGLERLAMAIQNVDDVYDLQYNKLLTYGDVAKRYEYELSSYCLDEANTELLFRHFEDYEQECEKILEKNLPYAAYELCIKLSNYFNLLEARGAIAVTERAAYIARVRNLVKKTCQLWINHE